MKPIFLCHPENKKLSAIPDILKHVLSGLSFLLFTLLPSLSQPVVFEHTAPSAYRIEFTDKNDTPFSINAPEKFLSSKAVERRQKQKIQLSYNDLPVTPAYIDSLAAAGAKILTTSKWFNAVTIAATDDQTLQNIGRLPFVKKYTPSYKSTHSKNLISTHQAGMQEFVTNEGLEYGSSWWQSAMHNGHLMHNRGFTGKGITIAVIDAGFYHVDDLLAFRGLWENGQIVGTRDFVAAGSNLFRQHRHGMSVLSIIGANVPGELVGTAPDASFWLLRSEDVNSEFLIEEDNWIAAAEFADSAGVDIINTSLGYSVFNDTLQNHTYDDLDGNTTRISKAADIAASKGMLVVVSAGNQGNSSWKYITAPADADSVLAVGAVDQSQCIASFSSRGPSSDFRVKPDVMAMGHGTSVVVADGSVSHGSGTSYASPLISGLAACLWQANPQANAMEIRQAICESSDRFSFPDSDYGYGIPDFNLAHVLLQINSSEPEPDRSVKAFPNPFNDQLYILFNTPVDESVEVSFYDITGNLLLKLLYPEFANRSYIKIEGEINNLHKGVYLLSIKAGEITSNAKLIKF